MTLFLINRWIISLQHIIHQYKIVIYFHVHGLSFFLLKGMFSFSLLLVGAWDNLDCNRGCINKDCLRWNYWSYFMEEFGMKCHCCSVCLTFQQPSWRWEFVGFVVVLFFALRIAKVLQLMQQTYSREKNGHKTVTKQWIVKGMYFRQLLCRKLFC